MRISVVESDAGYDPSATFAMVTLDGMPLLNCLTADEELGECLCLSSPIQVKDGNVVTEIKRGVVKITKPRSRA